MKAWYAEAQNDAWKRPGDIKVKFRSAALFADNRVAFSIVGNKYRVVAHVNSG